MLFNSYVFIFAFLPITLLVWFLLNRLGARRLAIVALVVASLVYYGYWNPTYLLLIAFSMAFNFGTGWVIGSRAGAPAGRLVMGLGVAVNLGLLGWFKYANFMVDSLVEVTGLPLTLAPITLPLAISFFTFQQVAFLVDTYRNETHEYDFVDYCLFVCFFPQLIAGPIVHHGEMLPQFTSSSQKRRVSEDAAVGTSMFVIGLFKKVVVADTLALFATPAFALAASGEPIGLFAAWGGLLAYSLQIYFDFSGYSDMAIGMARLFGIKLPLNFHSPYKAINIIDFWRRWHMTLSRFLRDYLYIPLGGNRKGRARRHVNLLVTMVLGGLWHGAGWTFVIWGGLHGLYLVGNHAWHALRRSRGYDPTQGTRLGGWVARGLTFLAVCLAWVFFRAPDVASAGRMLEGLAGRNGLGDALPVVLAKGLDPGLALSALLAVLLAVVWALPNSQQILWRHEPALWPRDIEDPAPGGRFAAWLTWRPRAFDAIVLAVMFVSSILLLSRYSEFIYFQF